MKATRLRLSALASILLISSGVFAAKHEFRTVEGDPLGTKMYTLPNGLKIFMSVNKDEPRIQTYIAVRVGGKNDPAETTGLAHYFEHLMFKGTEQYGTTDYIAEKPMLDKIEQLFETYRHTTDSTERAAIYHRIDSISYQASLLAIPNEYDKLMSAIGANGTNAYTSYDVTCYVENIPSNQIDNWARIQADRFEHPVIRGFHTELETIYEEKNMSLTDDSRKLSERMLSTLFPSHPYGTQTVLGTQENLKNPSITNVKNYHRQWYVPNNMAICVSGDFDPDNMVDIIEKYFGHLRPNPDLPVLQINEEKPITSPIDVEVLGKEAEMIYLAWRIPAAAHEDTEVLQIISEVLNNGKTGLLDVDVNLPQRTLGTGAGMYGMADQGAFLMIGLPKGGQSLDDVRAILLEEMAKLRNGDFSDDLLPAIINNVKLNLQKSFESNESRADYYVEAFVNGQEWADVVAQLSRLDKITKNDVVRVANKYFGDRNYAALYKRQGDDPNELKLSKPQLTPIAMNRDASSAFLQDIKNSEVEAIEPVFPDYDKDLTRLKAKNDIELLYTPNTTNDVFQLTYVYDFGSNSDPLLTPAAAYLPYVGTSSKSAQQIKDEFYKLACSYRLIVSQNRSYVMLNGLSVNMPAAMQLMEELMHDTAIDTAAYNAMVARMAQAETNAKTNQDSNFSALSDYMIYGENNPQTAAYNSARLASVKPSELTAAIARLNDYQHRAIYYGKLDSKEVVDNINRLHRTPASLKAVERIERFKEQTPEETIVYVAPYPAKQLQMCMYSNKGEQYGQLNEPILRLYNEYFGGGMNAIVFQEMRESRSLAYSAWAGFQDPPYKHRPYFFSTYIATQNDKMNDAITAFNDIIENMPQSDAAFNLAKQALDARLRTERTIKDNIAWSYINALDLGNDHDTSRDLFEALPSMTIDSVTDFQKKHVAGRTYYYCILGDTDDIDLEALSRLGRVVMLTPEQIFGY
ncbi:MAG: insulinase family protein [Muribaculaceae bacterium]|nr:insulinase family protein [Muribaculaceae bacterium]